jgi:hypothetical protein
MKTHRSSLFILILIALFVATACNLPALGSKRNGDQGTAEPTKNSDSIFNFGDNSSGNEEKKDEVNSKPVGIQDGLGSLDSYRFRIYMNMYDSTGTKNEVDSTIERSVVDGNVHQVTNTTTYDPEDDEEVNTDTNETYTVGTETCTKDDDAWDYEKIADDEKELRDIFTGMVDFLPLIDNPSFVGEELVNGVETNHFTFMVEGIGDTSGAIANVNQGEYWLAKDGDYIVKYNLTLEIQTAADGTNEAKTGNLQVQLDLTDINQPISITLPAGCSAQ